MLIKAMLAGLFVAAMASAPFLPPPSWCHLAGAGPPYPYPYSCNGACDNGAECQLIVAAAGGQTFYSCKCAGILLDNCSGWVTVNPDGTELHQCITTKCPPMLPDCVPFLVVPNGAPVCDCVGH